MAREILMKKLVLETDGKGNFVRGLVHYQMKVGGVLNPKIKTIGVTNWFKSSNLKENFDTAKIKIKEIEKLTEKKEI